MDAVCLYQSPGRINLSQTNVNHPAKGEGEDGLPPIPSVCVGLILTFTRVMENYDDMICYCTHQLIKA